MNHLRKYFSVAVAVIMLVMSIGITAHKMVCLVTGTVTLSFFQNEDCCATESANSNTVKTECCDYSTDYFRLDIQTLVSSFDFKFDLVSHFFTFPAFTFPELFSNKFSEVAHSPPLLSGKDILISFSVFRI